MAGRIRRIPTSRRWSCDGRRAWDGTGAGLAGGIRRANPATGATCFAAGKNRHGAHGRWLGSAAFGLWGYEVDGEDCLYFGNRSTNLHGSLVLCGWRQWLIDRLRVLSGKSKWGDRPFLLTGMVDIVFDFVCKSYLGLCVVEGGGYQRSVEWGKNNSVKYCCAMGVDSARQDAKHREPTCDYRLPLVSFFLSVGECFSGPSRFRSSDM